eukprot:TRINITY_DN2448_c0_g1_i1.p1 TRINITY_DN2448_c0_g1~~TRINITY_DN2448_c0_g1_i1.p1  ORF type:complete len:706 (+),score=82.92 TRINITY_DN2448_c0_g1_i1:51-2168(+)
MESCKELILNAVKNGGQNVEKLNFISLNELFDILRSLDTKIDIELVSGVLVLIKRRVAQDWSVLDSPQQRNIQNAILQSIHEFNSPYEFLSKQLADVAVKTALQSYPQAWDSLVSDICGQSSILNLKISMDVLEMLSEESSSSLFNFNLPQTRRNDILTGLKLSEDIIFEMISKAYNGEVSSLKFGAIKLMCSFSEWYSVSAISKYRLGEIFCDNLAIDEFRTVCVKGLQRIFVKWENSQNDNYFTRLLEVVLNSCEPFFNELNNVTAIHYKFFHDMADLANVVMRSSHLLHHSNSALFGRFFQMILTLLQHKSFILTQKLHSGLQNVSHSDLSGTLEFKSHVESLLIILCEGLFVGKCEFLDFENEDSNVLMMKDYPRFANVRTKLIESICATFQELASATCLTFACKMREMVQTDLSDSDCWMTTVCGKLVVALARSVKLESLGIENITSALLQTFEVIFQTNSTNPNVLASLLNTYSAFAQIFSLHPHLLLRTIERLFDAVAFDSDIVRHAASAKFVSICRDCGKELIKAFDDICQRTLMVLPSCSAIAKANLFEGLTLISNMSDDPVKTASFLENMLEIPLKIWTSLSFAFSDLPSLLKYLRLLDDSGKPLDSNNVEAERSIFDNIHILTLVCKRAKPNAFSQFWERILPNLFKLIGVFSSAFTPANQEKLKCLSGKAAGLILLHPVSLGKLWFCVFGKLI